MEKDIEEEYADNPMVPWNQKMTGCQSSGGYWNTRQTPGSRAAEVKEDILQRWMERLRIAAEGENAQSDIPAEDMRSDPGSSLTRQGTFSMKMRN